MRILQYNIQSVNQNRDNLDFVLNNYKIDLCILSETFSKGEGDLKNLCNFKYIEKARGDNYGGVAIYFRNTINVKLMDYKSSYDIIVAETINLNHNLIICSVYFPPCISITDFNTEITKLFDFLSVRKNVIVMGDFNARHSAWGDSIDSARGKNLFKSLSKTNFVCLNDGSHTFDFSLNNSGGSVLDLTFSNCDFPVQWKIFEEYIGKSHHRPILIDTDKVSQKEVMFLCKKKLIRALNLVELAPNFLQIENTFSERIRESHIRMKNLKFKYWWNDQLKSVWNELSNAKREWREFPSPEKMEIYLKKKKLLEKMCQES